MKTLYTAEATATGGRNGQIRSSDGVIDMAMSVPQGLGGKQGATNPEQLFAAGYASCFQQALLVIAQRDGQRLDPQSTVQCAVSLTQEGEAYGLAVTLDVDLKGAADADRMVQEAHRICPYSVGTRGNIDVQLKVNGQPAKVEATEKAS
ncbi:organic hydroperoxide resistance protein [Hymenobacter busanensis]|uniref:Organic hydroperoxide resistance protein n=1 Tax=Hymenobacter busanensis TaxID=2607656 RepID=A0A7L4ZW28_9BACT|nr:organic hydroperoxide resistance protein [Hymenobacter busanensis]KAA9339193.1 organic hydroperoxide resistance protein [Hymenobacter busanensis]QHJ07045.1 Ohr family peroxiredoxin [Hymenobacter busanensis]